MKTLNGRLPRWIFTGLTAALAVGAAVAAAQTLRWERLTLVRPTPEPPVAQRCLADYDTALGLDDPQPTEGGVA